MKPIICIPSYGRPKAKLFSKLEQNSFEKFIFVRQEQYPEYSYLEAKGFELIVLPSNVKEIGKTRRYIVYWCNKNLYEWAFMLDDDISKIETLARLKGGEWKSVRILLNEEASPRIEDKALVLWFKLAKQFDLSLSSPDHRAWDFRSHGNIIKVNKSSPIQCVLLHIPDIISAGNYESTF